jgi:predicted RNA binding protein YcfA (HicA-like mRNA interferase family)
MPELPTISGLEAISVFERFGFYVDRIRGSHHIMKREGHPHILTVPVHGNKPLKRGTLRGLVRAAGITVDEFVERMNE